MRNSELDWAKEVVLGAMRDNNLHWKSPLRGHISWMRTEDLVIIYGCQGGPFSETTPLFLFGISPCLLLTSFLVKSVICIFLRAKPEACTVKWVPPNIFYLGG